MQDSSTHTARQTIAVVRRCQLDAKRTIAQSTQLNNITVEARVLLRVQP